MPTCMKCDTEITNDNYRYKWTLMCDSCAERFFEQEKQQLEAENAEESKD